MVTTSHPDMRRLIGRRMYHGAARTWAYAWSTICASTTSVMICFFAGSMNVRLAPGASSESSGVADSPSTSVAAGASSSLRASIVSQVQT